jgi:hypothetical protein
MTISSTTVKNSYSGDGSQTTFVYGYKIFADSDIKVIIRSATGTETVKTITTHYTVTGAGSSSGGNVVFTSGNIPTNTETVVLIRDVPQTQAIDYIANDPFPAETHEEGLDRATMTTQQVQEELDRAIKISRTNTMTSTEFAVGATDRASKVLGFDASGELTVTQELGTNRGNWSSGTDYNARDLVKDTSTNNIFLVNTAHTSSGSQPLTTNANSAKYDLIVDAASATTSASSASTSASTATTKASEAATSATTATTKASEAATSASNASTSETNAAASFDSFDDRYLGAKASDPSVDNDGNALLTGALYFNSSDNVMKNYTGSAWQTLKPTSSEQTNINTLSASAVVTDMSILATTDVVADMNTLASADIVADMNTLATADVVSDMNTLATADIVSDMNTLATADVVTDMNTLGTADVVTDMNTLGTATNVTNMATVAANITGVNSFAERYRVDSSDPTSSLDEGDLAYNTTDNNLKFYNGSAWTSISPGIANVVDDSTPQLGGNLDVQTNSIVTTSNRNVLLAPNGTGMVEVKGNDNAGQIQLNCEQNSHGVKIKGPPHSAAQSYTLTLPSSITNDYYLKTDGSGNLSFAAVPTETKPTVADVSQTIAPATATTINITGANFVTVPIVDFINASTGAITRANTVSFTSSTSLSVNLTLASGNYFVRIENPDGNAGRSTNNIITASTAPSFSTSAGSLGSIAAGTSVSLSVAASSDSNVTIAETTSVLTSNSNTPAGTMNLTLSGTPATSATYNITGTAPTPSGDQTYNFTLSATDAEAQVVTRAFSITITTAINNSGQFN